MDSPEGRLTRRSATVTISAPDASCACFMISIVAYLPVPTISRDENSLPPRTRFVSLMLAAPHRSYDFHPVALAQGGRRVRALRRPLAVHGHRRDLARDAEVREQAFDAEPVGDLQLLAVHRDPHKRNDRALSGAGAGSILLPRFPSLGVSRSGSRGPGPHPVLRNPSPPDDSRRIPPGPARD